MTYSDRPRHYRPSREELIERAVKAQQAIVRRSLVERDAVARERAERTHRLVVIGATVESILGQQVDATTLAGVCQLYRDAMNDPGALGALQKLGVRARIERVQAARHTHEIAFKTRPPLALRRALKTAFWRYEPELCLWHGPAPDPDLERAIRTAGGVLTSLPAEDPE